MRFITVFLFVFSLGKAFGQNISPCVAVSLPNTKTEILEASTNGVQYKLYISLPETYEVQQNEYPVIYLLDADYSFALAKNITDHLSQRNDLTGVIIVGIAYDGPPNYQIHRTRDYTPTNAREGGYSPDIQEKYSGGAPKFLEFLEGELIPFVDNNYSTSAKRIIVGHSYGGLFCSWTLLEKPELFDGFIIVSPSLWYDDHELFRTIGQLEPGLLKDINVYLTVGDLEVNDRWNMPLDMEAFKGIIESKKVRRLHLRHKIEVGQTHNSIFPIGLSNGLRYVLEGS